MNTKVSFHNMPHSDALEQHIHQKITKIEDILRGQAQASPFNISITLKANKQHPHHAVNLNVKTPIFDLNAHDEGTDMYTVIDDTVDKMVALVRKEKERHLDKYHKPDTEKKKFNRL